MPTSDMVLRDIDAGLAEATSALAASTAEAGDPGEAGAVLDVGGFDAGAAIAADEAGAPPALIIPEPTIAQAIEKLQREGCLTTRTLTELTRTVAKHEKRHAHVIGHRRGFERGLHYGRILLPPGSEHRDVSWNRSREMRGFREDIIRRYARRHGGQIVEGIGYYYGTVQFRFDVTGTPTDAVLTLDVPAGGKPVCDSAFDYAIDETDPNWFPAPKKLTPTQTNLQEPGRNLYADELFFIEAMQASFQGVQPSYESSLASFDPAPTPGSPIYNMLTGRTLVWDRNSRVLPGGIFNQFNDVCELAQALAQSATVWFKWADRQLGANRNTSDKLVGRFSAIPGCARTGLRETSGAGMTLDLRRGFIWCLDKQFQASVDEGGNGLFDLEVRVDDSVAFPFQPIPLYGSPGPVMPDAIALCWQFTLWGTSLLPAKTEQYAVEVRRRA